MPTVNIKGAVEHTGLTEHHVRLLVKQGLLPHIKAGNRYLFRTETLDKWMDEEEARSIVPKEEVEQYGVLRKIKE